MTAIIGDAFERSEYRFFGELTLRPAGPQLVPPMLIMRGARGWNRRLDRISSGICKNAVRLHRREHQALVRRTAAFHFRAKLAGLKEEITANVRSL